MASLTLRLGSRAKKDGTYPVVARISHRCTNAVICTNVHVMQENFDALNLHRPISRKEYMAEHKNQILSDIVRKFDEVVFDLQRSETVVLSELTANDIRTYVVGEKKAEKKDPVKRTANSSDFMRFFLTYAGERKTENARRHYLYIYRVLTRYMEHIGCSCLHFEDIDYQWLVEFRKWIRSEISDVTRFKAESYIRAAYREAERRKLCSRADDPFLDFKIEQVPVSEEIDYARIEDIRDFVKHDFTQYGMPNFDMVRDIVVLCWGLCGANLIDIFNMPKPKDGEFVFVRSKMQTRSGRSVHIRIEPEVQRILEKYEGKELAFRFAEDHPSWPSWQNSINKTLRRMHKRAGTRVIFSQLRRSWATYAAMAGWPDRVIDKSMGHTDGSVLGRHYAQYDWSKTAECNRAMIDLLMEQ